MVKWIKLSVEMFDDDKIDFIQSLPEGDSIIYIWVRLLTLAGKCNCGGYIYLTKDIPYTEDTLAYKFRKPIAVIKLALETFKRLKMISIDYNGIFLVNWCKHQNLESLDKIKKRENARLRKQNQRERERKLKEASDEQGGAIKSNPTVAIKSTEDVARKSTSCDMSQDSHITCHTDVTHFPSYIDIDKDLDLDKDLERDKEKDKKRDIEKKIQYQEIMDYLNIKADTNFKITNTDTRKLIESRYKEDFILNDFKKVIDNKCEEWLDTSFQIYLRPSTLFGNKFEDYLNQKPVKKTKNSGVRGVVNDSFSNRTQRKYDMGKLEKQLLGWE